MQFETGDATAKCDVNTSEPCDVTSADEAASLIEVQSTKLRTRSNAKNAVSTATGNAIKKEQYEIPQIKSQQNGEFTNDLRSSPVDVNVADNCRSVRTRTSASSLLATSIKIPEGNQLPTVETSSNNRGLRNRSSSATTAPVADNKTDNTGRTGQLTDYFPIRRSERKPKATLLHERQMDIERKILQGSEDGLRVSTDQSKA